MFQTIYPGAYEGRALHIHVRVRTLAEGETIFTFTSQVFFPEETNAQVLATNPYNERPEADTTNPTDSIFLPELIAKTEGSAEQGLTASFRMRLSGLPEARGEPTA